MSRSILLVLLLAAVSACGNEPTDPIGTPQVADVDQFVGSLGSWEAYSPPLTAGDNAAGPPTTVEEVVDNTTYVCTVTPRSLTTTPNELVMYEPNASIMWVGNLIQGDSYTGGTGSFEELSIRQRSPLKISIDLLTGNNFAIVDNPSLTSVQAAIGDLIQRATDAGHLGGSSVDFDSYRMHATIEAIQKAGLSAKFLLQGVPVELEAETGWNVNASYKGVFAHFTQKMFTISIELPQSPSAIFSDDLTPELLQAQIDAGNIGPNNLPVYIASITYGRTLSYSLVSTDAEARLHMAVRASFEGYGAVSGGGYSELDLRTTLGSEHLHATAIGGDGQNVINLIREGNLSAYFTSNPPLTSARPISYQLNFLGNNSIAKVSETTDYDLRECNEKAVSPGHFDFLAAQTISSGIPSPYTVQKGDFNGDGRQDLMINHVQSGTNQTRIGLANTDGTFTFGAVTTHPQASPTGGWADNYKPYVGDFDGDGNDDVLWDRVKSSQPRLIHVALSDGAGGFASFLPEEQIGVGNWAAQWQTYVGGADADADDDLFFNYRAGTANYTMRARSDGDGRFTIEPARRDHPVASSGWLGYQTFIADVDGGARDDDFIWNATPGDNRVWVGQAVGDSIAFRAHQDIGAGGWGPYTTHVGDFDATGTADLIWTNTQGPTLYVHRARASGGHTYSFINGAIGQPRGQAFDSVATIDAYVADFDSDGRDDVLFNQRGAANTVMLGLASPTTPGDFSFATASQQHPATKPWAQYSTLPMDVTGDARDDIVWYSATSNLEIAVAQSRP